ncbi:hypothetical protein KVR01_007683 [Diaporthe batatas]|uniref:uncharacterized protein n=1 Tax=Diaporthe batatas TaxID=748121 RepID=UPI001D051B30|nr:uncharacterized protein KVR01_007683 [Diaporthe batatas]KAG8161918.1 hypothetical protein KVR01_007683 [Diaporthe batatas]
MSESSGIIFHLGAATGTTGCPRPLRRRRVHPARLGHERANPPRDPELLQEDAGKVLYQESLRDGSGSGDDSDGSDGGASSWVYLMRTKQGHDYGGYFDLDNEEGYVECDAQGKPISRTTTKDVFYSQSRKAWFYIGSHHFRQPVTIEKSPKNRTFFKNSQGKPQLCQCVDPKALATINQRVRSKTFWLKKQAPPPSPKQPGRQKVTRFEVAVYFEWLRSGTQTDYALYTTI